MQRFVESDSGSSDRRAMLMRDKVRKTITTNDDGYNLCHLSSRTDLHDDVVDVTSFLALDVAIICVI